jgi:hypothetical protein
MITPAVAAVQPPFDGAHKALKRGQRRVADPKRGIIGERNALLAFPGKQPLQIL